MDERRKTILVVEDDEALKNAYGAMFAAAGYNMIAAHDSEALALVRQHKPDLVILDAKMNVVPGRDICSELKSQPATKGIPIIVISGYPEAVRYVKDFGADEFVQKPFEPREVLELIARKIASSHVARSITS
jgi:two-component system phosphate regulon response regulator PhoB